MNKRIFACCIDDGRVYGYYLGPNIQLDIEVDKLFTIQSEQGCRELIFINTTNQLVVGHDSGIVSVYNVDQPKSPFYSRKLHNSSITKLDYLIDTNTLLTASKDQSIKFWKIKHDKGETVKQIKKPKTEFDPFKNLEDDEDDPFDNAKNMKKKEKPNIVQTTESRPLEKQKEVEEDQESDEDMAGWND